MEASIIAQYIHFSDEQKHRANSVDLPEFLRHKGEKLIPSGQDKRLASDHSITVRGNQWFDHASEKGGLAIETRVLPDAQIGIWDPYVAFKFLVEVHYVHTLGGI